MMRVVLAEWRKLRRPTLFLGTLGAALFFTGLTTSFLYLMIDSEQGNSDRGRQVSREILDLASGSVFGFASVGGLLGVIALCVFAAQTAQEYTYGTLRNLLVRQPGRVRLLVGKLIAMKIFALLLVAIAAIVSVGLSVALSGRAKVSTELWFTTEGFQAIGESLLNVSISVIYFGIVGMVLGLLLRSPISAISIGVLWLLIIENLIGAVKPGTLDWMPGNQLSTIAQGGTPDVSYSHALILGTLYVFIGGIVATVLFSRRDVAN
jgi:ABC-type transport system involved in multi-copper enzyme maturation permease subunit